MVKRVLKNWVVRLTKPRLVKAARKGDFARIQRLLAAGFDVDASDRYGRTPLMEACRVGHNEAVQLLLEHGADPYKVSFSARDAFGYTLNLEVLETLSTQQPLKGANGRTTDLPRGALQNGADNGLFHKIN